MVAGLEHRKQRGRDRRKPRRQQRDAGAGRSLDLLDRGFQRLRGRRAAAAVEILAAAGREILGGAVEQRRGVIDRRVDVTVMRVRVAAAGGDLGVGFEFRRLRASPPSGLVIAMNSSAASAFTASERKPQPLDLLPRAVLRWCNRGDRAGRRRRERAGSRPACFGRFRVMKQRCHPRRAGGGSGRRRIGRGLGPDAQHDQSSAACSTAARTARSRASACRTRKAAGPASTSISARRWRRRSSTIRTRSSSCR